MFYVIGGEWESTKFDTIVSPEIFGPFNTYEEAKVLWHSLCFTPSIDNCLHRFIIKEHIPVGILSELRECNATD